MSERNAQIIAAYKAGETMQSIADRHGISRQRVEQITRPALKAGIIPSWRGLLNSRDFTAEERALGHAKRHKNAWPPALEAEVRRLVDRRYSASMIADAVGKSRNAVIGWCNRNGVKLNPCRRTLHLRASMMASALWADPAVRENHKKAYTDESRAKRSRSMKRRWAEARAQGDALNKRAAP